MAVRGWFTSITQGQMRQLLEIRHSDLDDDECDEAILESVERIESKFGSKSPFYYDVDKAWDAIHRSLTGDQTPDGMVNPNAGKGSLKLCVLGGMQLLEADHPILTLVKPNEARKVVEALNKIGQDELRKRFFQLDPTLISDYPIDEEEFEYTWSNFVGLRTFYKHTANKERAVLFMANT